MPPLPPIASVVRVQLKHTVGDDLDALDRIYMSYTGMAPTTADMVAFVSSVGTAWATHLQAFAGGWVTLTEVLAQDLSSDTAAVAQEAVSLTGTRAGADLPAGVAVLINFGIARRYRGGKPRVYVPYFTDSDVLTPQTWSATSVANLQAAFQAFIAEIVAAVWAGGGPMAQTSVSYYEGSEAITSGSGSYIRGKTKSLPKPGGPVAYAVTNVLVSSVPSSQRRRNRPG
jgi:hypothetical protein